MAQSTTLAPEEKRWLRKTLTTANRFVAHYLPDAGCDRPEAVPNPAQLDSAYDAWQQTRYAGNADATAVLEMLGLALGRYLASQVELRWVMLVDRQGRSPALEGPGAFLAVPGRRLRDAWLAGESAPLTPLATELLREFHVQSD